MALDLGTEASQVWEEAGSWGSLTSSEASLLDGLWDQSIGRVPETEAHLILETRVLAQRSGQKQTIAQI